MKKKQVGRRNALQHGARVGSNHPLVGTWEEEPNPILITSVVYTVFVKQGKFGVSGRDEEDGTVLEISQTNWDGESLHFTSLYPPTKHKAKQALRVLSKGRMSHDVRFTDADGSFLSREVWTKKRSKKKRGNVQKS